MVIIGLKKDDVISIKILENKHFDYIKCDRFWNDSIVGKIPFIRYFGNALASFFNQNLFRKLEVE